MRMTSRGYYKKIDFIFFNEKKIRAAVSAARNDIQKSQVKGGGISNPTEAAALRNVSLLRSVLIDGEKLEWPEKWLQVVDATRLFCSSDISMTQVLHDMYVGVDYRRTCVALSISTSTLTRLKYKIRDYAALCAANLQLLRFV